MLFGQSAGEAGTIEAIACDFASNQNHEFRSAGIWEECEFHDPTGAGNIGALFVAPSSLKNCRFYRCTNGLLFEATLQGANAVIGYIATDNVTADVRIRDGNTVELRSSVFDPAKIALVP